MAITYKIGYFYQFSSNCPCQPQKILKSYKRYKNYLSYLEYFSKHFLCSDHNSHKVLLVVINVNLPLKLFCSSFLVVVTINNGCFLIQKFFWRFRSFRVFTFCHRAYSKTRKPRTNLLSSFLKIFLYLKTIYLISRNFVSSVNISQSIAQSCF